MRWALLILLTLSLARAQTNDTSAQLERDITAFEEVLRERQAELEALEAALAQTGAALDAQVSERDRLANEIVALSEQQEALGREVETLKLRQRDTGRRIVRLQARLGGLEEKLKQLIVGLHKRRAGRYARALAQSESLFELRVKNHYLSRLTAQDVSLIETLNATVAELSRARQARARQVRALGGRERQLRRNQGALRAAQGELEAVIAQLTATREGQLAQQRALLAEQGQIETNLGGTRAALARELERLQRVAEEERQRAGAAAQVAAELAGRRRAPSDARDDASSFQQAAARLERAIRALDEPAPAPERNFAPPFADPVLVRPYGEGRSDIWLRAAQPGTAVQAVKSGVVYRASRITANSGYTVAIQHGSNLISAYSNLQRPVVEEGDQVAQGQVIGYLGGGIIPTDILEFRLGTPDGLEIVYQDPAPLLGLR